MSTATSTGTPENTGQRTRLTVDLRSDTVTKPTPEMRRAMAEAEVGDDVYGEDPTINRLEQRAAEIFGREAAIFVPSGTMGNQVAIKIHTRPGQEIICEERCHVFNYEMAMMAHFSGCLARPIHGEDGILRWVQIERKIAPKTYYYAQTGLVSLENTHNMAGGTVYPQPITDEICDGAHAAALPVHLDGARVFNASIALGKPVAEITRKFDSVMFCLSKGLGAPVGSLLVGSGQFITQARIYRKSLGGGMRQAGVLAAAGLIALQQMPHRMHVDHENAKFLAQGLARVPGIKVDPAKVLTNIVICDISGAGMVSADFSRKLAENSVLCGTVNTELVRFVTHMDVDRAGCERALEAVREICAK
ncbi:MAG: aminotransferase class I/II-fold pyridoxal phosphate-dependent enzyme [Acidobacteriia bacterium]|nr:aminotransferase class I/II-fold pyridoxal phosphate-dependent enzyme [Terriglobia bacterium]